MAMSTPSGLCQRCSSEGSEETLWSSISSYMMQYLCSSSPSSVSIPPSRRGLEEVLPRSCIAKSPIGFEIGEVFDMEVEDTVIHSSSIFDKKSEEVLTGISFRPEEAAVLTERDTKTESVSSPSARLLDGALGYRLVWSASNWKTFVDDSAPIRSFGVVR